MVFESLEGDARAEGRRVHPRHVLQYPLVSDAECLVLKEGKLACPHHAELEVQVGAVDSFVCGVFEVGKRRN